MITVFWYQSLGRFLTGLLYFYISIEFIAKALSESSFLTLPFYLGQIIRIAIYYLKCICSLWVFDTFAIFGTFRIEETSLALEVTGKSIKWVKFFHSSILTMPNYPHNYILLKVHMQPLGIRHICGIWDILRNVHGS